MATGNRLGAAYVEVEGDVVSFVRKLRQELIKAANDLKVPARFMGEMIGHEMEQGIKGTGRNMARRIQAELRAARITASVHFDADKRSLAGVTSAASAAASTGGNGQAGKLLGNVFGNVSGLAASPSGLAVLAVLVVTLTGAVVALGTQLGLMLSFALLIPGALAGVMAATLPLVVALKNVNAAISAGMLNDPAALAEAFRGMPEVLRTIAKEAATLPPILKEIEFATTQAFAEPVVGVIESIGKKLLPAIGEGFEIVSGAAGRFAASIGAILTSPEAVAGIKNVFVTMGQIIDHLISPLGVLFRGLGALVNASMPALVIIAIRVGELLEELGQWFTDIAADGRFVKFLDEAMAAMGRLWDIGVALWNMLIAIIDQAKDEAEIFMWAILEVINVFTLFFQSEIGKLALQGIIDLAIVLVVTLGAIGLAIGVIMGLLEGVIRTVVFLIDKIMEAIGFMRDLAGLNNAGGGGMGGGAFGGSLGSSEFGSALGRAMSGIKTGTNRTNVPRTSAQYAGGFDPPVQTGVQEDKPPVVNVYIGDEKIDAKAVKAAHALLERQGRELSYGPRVAA